MLESIWILISCVLIFSILIRVPENETSGIQDLGFNTNSSRSGSFIFDEPFDVFIWILIFLLFFITSLFVLSAL